MTTDFQIQALPITTFLPWFDLNPDQRQRGARWLTVDASPGYPCRVSLTDAKLGEQVLALPYTHHDVPSPYRASGPIFVREQAVQTQPGINEIPTMLLHRQLSLRAYDADHMMVGAEVVEGAELATIIHHQCQNPAVQYVHLHNAKPGCYMCSVHRIEPA